jgi:hypothetical protein
MPSLLILAKASIPVFASPSTSSDKLGKLTSGRRYPFLGESPDASDSKTNWYQLDWSGTPAWAVESSHGHDYLDVVEGEQGEGNVALTESAPEVPGAAPWENFAVLLPHYLPQTYALHNAQMPLEPLGLEGWLTKHIGNELINCSNTTVSLVPNAMHVPITKKMYGWWQVFGDSKGSGYGPAAAVAAGFATKVADPKRTAPADGIYLVQDFSRWPKGHSYLVCDFDPATGRFLSLESSSWTIDGCGWKGIANLRETLNPGADWAGWMKRPMVWADRRSDYPEVYMAKLHVDHASFRAWLTG